jgi:hypothetical protein
MEVDRTWVYISQKIAALLLAMTVVLSLAMTVVLKGISIVDQRAIISFI